MSSRPPLFYGVVTGDVVGSSALSPARRRRLLEVMRESSRELRKILGGDTVPLDVDLFRGDSWQILLTDPVQSLRGALLFRAMLRWRMESHRFDTRLAIGVGKVDLVPDRRVSEGSGEAFRASGLALDGMRKRRMCFAFPGSDAGPPLDVLVHLLDGIAVRWTDMQARAVIGAMQGWTQKKIASRWGGRAITQQAAALHLDGAGWYAVDRGVREFERLLAAGLEARAASL